MYGSRAQKWQWSRGWGTQLQGEQSGNKQMPLTKMPECNDYTGRPGLGGNCSRLSHPEKCNKGIGPTTTPAGPLGPHGLTGLPILNPLIPWRRWQSQKMCHQLPKLTLNLRGGDSRTQYQDTICRCSPRAGTCTGAWACQEVPPGAARTLRKKLDVAQS